MPCLWALSVAQSLTTIMWHVWKAVYACKTGLIIWNLCYMVYTCKTGWIIWNLCYMVYACKTGLIIWNLCYMVYACKTGLIIWNLCYMVYTCKTGWIIWNLCYMIIPKIKGTAQSDYSGFLLPQLCLKWQASKAYQTCVLAVCVYVYLPAIRWNVSSRTIRSTWQRMAVFQWLVWPLLMLNTWLALSTPSPSDFMKLGNNPFNSPDIAFWVLVLILLVCSCPFVLATQLFCHLVIGIVFGPLSGSSFEN